MELIKRWFYDMKRQIRKGVFETNSSSMHSLVVMKRNDIYTPEEFMDGIYLYDDRDTKEPDCVWEPYEGDLEFGRSPFRALGTFSDKWLYACASLVHDYNDNIYKELVTIALKYVPCLKKIKMPMTTLSCAKKYDEECENDSYRQKYGKTEEELIEYLSKKEKDWGIEIEYWEHEKGLWRYDAPDTGYVDEDILSGFLKKENITLEEFLINKKYVVIQDGDEYCYYNDMKDAGLINLDAIDHEYPRELE